MASRGSAAGVRQTAGTRDGQGRESDIGYKVKRVREREREGETERGREREGDGEREGEMER